MAVNISGGGLEFTAGIDTSGFNADIAAITQKLNNITNAQVKQQEAANNAQKEYARLLLASGASLDKLDAGVQSQIKSLNSLTTELKNVKAAQSDLNIKFPEGSGAAFEAEMARLVTRENELSSAINKVTADLQNNDAVVRSTNRALIEKSVALENLKAEYQALLAADKGNAALGANMLSSIKQLEGELATVTAGFSSAQAAAFANINDKTAQLSKLKDEFTALSDAQKNDKGFGGKLQSDIQSLEAELKNINRDFVQLSKISSSSITGLITSASQSFAGLDKNIQNQIRALAALEDELKKVQGEKILIEAKFATTGSEEYETKILKLSAREKELSATINTVTTDLQRNDSVQKLTNGTILQKSEMLQKLRADYQALLKSDSSSSNLGASMLANIQKLEAELRNVTSGFSQAQAAAFSNITQKIVELTKLKDQYKSLSDVQINDNGVGGKMLADIQNIEHELQKINNDFNQLSRSSLGSLNDKIAQVAKLKSEYAALSDVDRKNPNMGGALLKNIKGLDREVAKINAQFNQTESVVNKAALALGAYFSLQTATNFVKDIVRVRGEFQQLETAFRVMLGNKEKADQLLAQGVTLAAKTPFTLSDVGAGAKQLLAYGFAADDVIDTLKTLGNVASGVGAPLNDLVYLYGTLRSTGRATQIDLQQFAGRGIPIYEALAKVLNITATESESVTAQIRGLVTAGKIGFGDVEKAFQSLTGTGGQFFNLMEEQSKTLTGLTSNLEDAWQRMQNELGKSGEGLFVDAIKGATALIDNYKDVIKAIEVIAIAYGSYRAAIIATNAAMFIASGIQNGLTVGQALYQAAVVISDRVTKLFNATLLANPAALVVGGVVALASALYLFRDAATDAQKAQEKLNEVSAEANKQIDIETDKLGQLLDIAKDETKSKEDRLIAIKKLNKESPILLGNITLENIKTQETTEAIGLYIKGLESKAKAQAASSAIEKLYADRQAAILKGQQNENQSLLDNLKAGALGAAGNLAGAASENIKDNQKRTQEIVKGIDTQIEAVKKLYKEDLEGAILNDGKKAESKKRTISVIDDEIKALREEQSLQSTTRAEFLAFDKQISKLEAEARGIKGASKKEIQENKKAESDINSMLEARKGILQDLEDIKRDAKQSGLIKEQSEIDKVNEKYDEAIKKVEEYNLKVAEFNSKNPKAKVAAIGLNDIADLNKSRLQEVTNVTFKIDAENYKKQLERQKDIFAQFEEAKKDIGVAAANDMYSEQTGGFETYIKFLEAEAAKILPKVFAGTANIGDQQKLIEIGRQRNEEIDKQNDEAFKKQKQQYIDLIDASQSFQLQRAAVETKYNTLYATLAKIRGKISESEFADRLKALDASKKEELDIITNNELEKSDIYKQFEKGFGKIGITATAGILKGLKALRDQMKGMGKDVTQLNKDIDTTALALNQKSVSGIRDAATLLRNSFKDLNIQVAGQLKITTGQISDALDNVATLLSKDSSKGQQVGSIIGLISFIIVGIRDALLTAKDIADPLQAQKDYYSQISNEIAASNELLVRQKKILDDILGVQKLQLSANYLADIDKKQAQAMKSLKDFQLSVIQSSREFYVDPVFHTKVSTGGINALADVFLYGGQAKRNVELDLKIVDTSRFTTIEEFAELLQKIREGGGKLDGKVVVKEDIDSLEALIDNYDKLVAQQKEFRLQFQAMLTGTTSASITDSIVDGFRNGLRSANDFAKTFEDLMKNAILQSLKIQALEGPLKAFFDEFADFSATDEVLTEDEIRRLRANFTGIIDDAGKKFDQLQKITNVDFATQGQAGNSLTGAIKGITEQQADLLAGQFGGLRLTAGEQLNIASQQLNVLNSIQANTAWIQTQYQLWQRIELNGMKIKP